MVSEKQLLMELRKEEKKAQDRLKSLANKKKLLLKKAKDKARIKALKQQIKEAKAKGSRTRLTDEQKRNIKVKARKVAKKTGFVLDVIAYGYGAAKGQSKKKKRF